MPLMELMERGESTPVSRLYGFVWIVAIPSQAEGLHPLKYTIYILSYSQPLYASWRFSANYTLESGHITLIRSLLCHVSYEAVVMVPMGN
jgi:hypothetical protein